MALVILIMGSLTVALLTICTFAVRAVHAFEQQAHSGIRRSHPERTQQGIRRGEVRAAGGQQTLHFPSRPSAHRESY